MAKPITISATAIGGEAQQAEGAQASETLATHQGIAVSDNQNSSHSGASGPKSRLQA